MDFGSNVVTLRKEQKTSQTALADKLGIHKNVLGSYKYNEVFPSIEMATQLAEALKVSFDYLVGSTDTLLEMNVGNRILDIQKLNDNDKQHVFALLDAFLKQSKLQAII